MTPPPIPPQSHNPHGPPLSSVITSFSSDINSYGRTSPLTVVVAVLAVFVALPFAAWALYIAAHLPIWAWYASLFPH